MNNDGGKKWIPPNPNFPIQTVFSGYSDHDSYCSGNEDDDGTGNNLPFQSQPSQQLQLQQQQQHSSVPESSSPPLVSQSSFLSAFSPVDTQTRLNTSLSPPAATDSIADITLRGLLRSGMRPSGISSTIADTPHRDRKRMANGILVNSNARDLFTVETASKVDSLTISHVITRIFTFIPTMQLKECRFVCKTWSQVGATELQKRSLIILHLASHSAENPKNTRESLNLINFPRSPSPPSPSSISPSSSSLSRRNGIPSSYEHPHAPILQLIRTVQHSHIFPCTDFSLITSQIGSPYLHQLLSSIGHRIKTFCLDLRFLLLPPSVQFEHIPVFSHLRHILTKQIVNVESLRLLFWVPRHWTWDLNTWNYDNNLHLFDNNNNINIHYHDQNKNQTAIQNHIRNTIQIQDPNQNQGCLHSRIVLPKLKSLSIEGNCPPKACQELIEAAINLQSFSIFPQENSMLYFHLAEPTLSYFTRGIGRSKIYLLKELHFFPTDESILAFESFMKENSIVTNEMFRIETLGLVNFRETYIAEVKDFWKRVARISNYLLVASSRTIKKLIMCPLRILPQIQIPPMFKLEAIEIQCYLHMPANCESHFFPEGFNIQRNFPRLEVIEAEVRQYHSRYRFTEQMGVSEPVESVKRIQLTNCAAANVLFYERMAKLFPRARIYKTY